MAKLIDVKTFFVIYELEFYSDGLFTLTKVIKANPFSDHPLKDKKIKEYEEKMIGHLSKKGKELFEEANLRFKAENKHIYFSIFGDNYEYDTETGIISKITLEFKKNET